ncbi:MAG: 50S ribosomal protein L28 [Geminicoccaceae bacterium]
MARRCTFTHKGVQSGNNVSHANNKTRRRFLPNIKSRNLFSETLGRSFRVKIAASTLRTIEKVGGLDTFLVGFADVDLPGDLVRVKHQIVEKKAASAAA